MQSSFSIIKIVGPTGWGIGSVALRRTALPKLLPHFMDAPNAMWRTYNNVKKDVVDNPDCFLDRLVLGQRGGAHYNEGRCLPALRPPSHGAF